VFQPILAIILTHPVTVLFTPLTILLRDFFWMPTSVSPLIFTLLLLGGLFIGAFDVWMSFQKLLFRFLHSIRMAQPIPPGIFTIIFLMRFVVGFLILLSLIPLLFQCHWPSVSCYGDNCAGRHVFCQRSSFDTRCYTMYALSCAPDSIVSSFHDMQHHLGIAAYRIHAGRRVFSPCST